jgi:hypothetical protein
MAVKLAGYGVVNGFIEKQLKMALTVTVANMMQDNKKLYSTACQQFDQTIALFALTPVWIMAVTAVYYWFFVWTACHPAGQG